MMRLEFILILLIAVRGEMDGECSVCTKILIISPDKRPVQLQPL